MTWFVMKRSRRFAASAEIASAVADAKKQDTSPVAQRVIAAQADYLNTLLNNAPHDCDVAVATSGDMNPDGTGTAKTIIPLRGRLASSIARLPASLARQNSSIVWGRGSSRARGSIAQRTRI